MPLPKHSLLSHRTRSARETCDWATPIARACGVTRVAGITTLDHIGIPVYQAFRPNAWSISVSAGKGIDDHAARASALMEAIELAHAETVRPHGPPRAFHSITGQPDEFLDPSWFAHPRAAPVIGDIPIHWLPGRDLLAHSSKTGLADDSAPVSWVPYDAVHCDFRMQTIADTAAGAFRTTSNGLASGSTLAEAICHGLCEVVERHCLFEWVDTSREHRAGTKVALDSIDDEHVQRLLQQLARADMITALWDMTGDLDIPVYRCAICDGSPDGFYALMPSLGAGCHPSTSHAIRRAITEAAQARLTVISGAREDISHAVYEAGNVPRLWEAQRAELQDTPARRDIRDQPERINKHVETDIAWLLSRLADAGVERAVYVDLSRDDPGVPVVRVLVPGLRSPTPHADRGHIDDPGL